MGNRSYVYMETASGDHIEIAKANNNIPFLWHALFASSEVIDPVRHQRIFGDNDTNSLSVPFKEAKARAFYVFDVLEKHHLGAHLTQLPRYFRAAKAYFDWLAIEYGEDGQMLLDVDEMSWLNDDDSPYAGTYYIRKTQRVFDDCWAGFQFAAHSQDPLAIDWVLNEFTFGPIDRWTFWQHEIGLSGLVHDYFSWYNHVREEEFAQYVLRISQVESDADDIETQLINTREISAEVEGGIGYQRPLSENSERLWLQLEKANATLNSDLAAAAAQYLAIAKAQTEHDDRPARGMRAMAIVEYFICCENLGWTQEEQHSMQDPELLLAYADREASRNRIKGIAQHYLYRIKRNAGTTPNHQLIAHLLLGAQLNYARSQRALAIGHFHGHYDLPESNQSAHYWFARSVDTESDDQGIAMVGVSAFFWAEELSAAEGEDRAKVDALYEAAAAYMLQAITRNQADVATLTDCKLWLSELILEQKIPSLSNWKRRNLVRSNNHQFGRDLDGTNELDADDDTNDTGGDASYYGRLNAIDGKAFLLVILHDEAVRTSSREQARYLLTKHYGVLQTDLPGLQGATATTPDTESEVASTPAILIKIIVSFISFILFALPGLWVDNQVIKWIFFALAAWSIYRVWRAPKSKTP